MMQKCFGLSVKRGNQKCFFSLVKIGFLKFRVIVRTREKDVFIEANNWLREKTRLPFEIVICGFILRPGRRTQPQNESRENRGNIGGFLTADYDRRLRPREINGSGLNGGWKPPIITAEISQSLLD